MKLIGCKCGVILHFDSKTKILKDKKIGYYYLCPVCKKKIEVE